MDLGEASQQLLTQKQHLHLEQREEKDHLAFDNFFFPSEFERV